MLAKCLKHPDEEVIVSRETDDSGFLDRTYWCCGCGDEACDSFAQTKQEAIENWNKANVDSFRRKLQRQLGHWRDEWNYVIEREDPRNER